MEPTPWDAAVSSLHRKVSPAFPYLGPSPSMSACQSGASTFSLGKGSQLSCLGPGSGLGRNEAFSRRLSRVYLALSHR